MPRDFFPRREADIVGWTANFSQKISAAPGDYGLTPALAADYALLRQAFTDAYYTAQSPGTDSSTAIVAKDHAREALEAATRPLVRVVKALPTVTDGMLSDLGLGPRPQRRAHVPAPDTAPILRITGSTGGAVRVRLVDAGSTRLGKPRDVTGAVIFGFVGEWPPTGREGWQYKGTTSRAVAEARFDAGLPPGTKVWLTAYWTNARGEKGPACAPVYTHLQYGVAMQTSLMRQAA